MPSADLQHRAFAFGEQLNDLHFPVGGRRFRPAAEDFIEFLIVEGVATGRPGWEKAVDEHRDRFRMIQLRAAVRRNPDVAREELDALDRSS